MKLLILFIAIFIGWNASAQNLYLTVSGKNDLETKIIDSVVYSKKHLTRKSVLDEVKLLSNKLTNLGFIDNQVLNDKTVNDSLLVFDMNLEKKINFIRIYIGRNSDLQKMNVLDSKTDTLQLKYSKIEQFMTESLRKLEQNGFALSTLKLINFERNNNDLCAELYLTIDKKRKVNNIVINGYDKFPAGYKKNLIKKYKNLVFNKNNLERIYSDFNKIRFVRQTKYPEILFTKDSTKVYIYVEKAKTNSFDGILGFANDDNKKLIFNGYVDLTLNNALNVGEKLALYWKSDGRNQKTINVATEVPHIFKTPFGIKAQLNIFKQDSIFQNTKTNLDLGYYLNLNSKAYIGYQATESNDINNTKSLILADSNNSFITSTYEFIDYYPEASGDDVLFPEKTNFVFRLGTGKRDSKTQTSKQLFASLNLNYHFYINKNNAINLKTQNYYLKSSNYLTNELFRFGGINSIRGFNENSLQGNTVLSLMTEYQYIISDGLYFHSVLDYGFYEDKTVNKISKLLGFGFGFGLQTKNGFLNFVYANGSSNEQAIKFSNSVVQVSLRTTF